MKVPLKGLLGEFRSFAFKGNMIDLAVGVVIGAAFGKIIDSIVKNIILPIVSYVPGLHGGWEHWHFGKIMIGPVLAEILNFVLVAAAVFFVIVKVIGMLAKVAVRKQDEAAAAMPTTKECPKCCSTIPVKAVKCAHCTADLDNNTATAGLSSCEPG